MATTGPHIFGAAPGHLTERAIRRAQQLGADVVNHTDSSCACGYGCRPFDCARAGRHWFTIPDSSNARQIGRAILAQLRAEGLLSDDMTREEI
jgi:hypothetical protein